LGVKKLDLEGNPYLGVLCSASEAIAICPVLTTKRDRQKISETLGVEVIPMSIQGASILGSLCALNSHGMMVPEFTLDQDIVEIRKNVNVGELPSKLTAAGNNILCNDKIALIHEELNRQSRRLIADVLDVEVVAGTIAGLETVGSVAYATNKGLLVHPKTTEDELETLSEAFRLPIKKTTANYGTPFIGACLIANSRGAVVGSLSTGIELGNIEDSLDIID
jgi:translation initiation factor 6